jgi:hypothetical protein
MRQLTRRETLLLILLTMLIASPVIPLVINSRQRHMWQLRRHVARVAPVWEDFRRENQGFEHVRLLASEKGICFAATGYVPSQGHLERLRTFMESTKPPQPVYLFVEVRGGDEKH